MLAISLDSLGIRLAGTASWDVAFWLGVFMAIAMFVLVPLRTGRSLPTVAIEGGVPMAASVLLQASSLTFFVLAVTLTTVANTVIIIAAAPVVAALVAHLVLGERTTRRTWFAMALSMAGVWIVVSGSLGSGQIEGDLFAVAAILAFATNLTLWRRFPDLNRLAVVGLGGLTVAIVALAPADPLAVDTRALVILAIIGGLTGSLGRVSVATSTKYLPASRVGLFVPVETVAAIVWAWLFLDETPTAQAIVGGVIVITAVIYGGVWQQKVSPPVLES
jgi:drug/metabolite transporter (DMT)-like permease